MGAKRDSYSTSRWTTSREYCIVATSLEELDDNEYHGVARSACDEFVRGEISEEHWHRFRQRISYVPESHGATGLAEAVGRSEATLGGEPNRLHYLSIPPDAADVVVRTLGEAKLTDRARIIMEKPFGTDLPTARHLNGVVQETFDDDQVFRIDHFQGKEAAQNIPAFRFANGLFEPIWNREHIDHIQIDVPEALSVGKRGAFYEQTGAFRDMVVTHLFENRKVGDVEQLGSNGPRLRVDVLDPERPSSSIPRTATGSGPSACSRKARREPDSSTETGSEHRTPLHSSGRSEPLSWSQAASSWNGRCSWASSVGQRCLSRAAREKRRRSTGRWHSLSDCRSKRRPMVTRLRSRSVARRAVDEPVSGAGRASHHARP